MPSFARHAARASAAAALWALAGATGGLAAQPSPSPQGGDPRSPGEGPGLVGDPLLAIGVVVAIALAAVVVTMLWVRLTSGPGDGRGSS